MNLSTWSNRSWRSAARKGCGAVLCLASLPGLAQTASAPGGSAWRFSGFGTLGMVQVDAPAGWGFRRDIALPGHEVAGAASVDSRLGLQLNYAVTPQFELVGQVIAMRRTSDAKPAESVEWAFAAFRPNADLTLRLGRVNLDAFLMSDYRQVGFGFVPVRPPVDFYGNLPGALDGADVAQQWRQGGVTWRLKAYAGRAFSGDRVDNGKVEVRPVLGTMVSREAHGLLLRAGWTRSAVATDAPALLPLLDALSAMTLLPVPEVADQASALRERFDYRGHRVDYLAAGFSYDWHAWQFSGEVTRVSGHRSANFSAGYGSVARRFGSVTLFGLASRIHSPEPITQTPDWTTPLTPLIGAPAAQQAQMLAAAATYGVNKSRADQRTLSLGARWDLQPQLALKLQWSRIHVDTGGGRLWARASLDAARAQVTSLALDFVF